MLVNINKYDPLKSGKYIPLPAPFHKSRFIINVQNTDDRCFFYCIYSRFLSHHTSDPSCYNNIEKYVLEKYKVSFSWDMIEFPTSINHIAKFCNLNPSVSINVFGLEDKKIYPIRITDIEKTYHYDLLYLTDGDNSHYCSITNFASLIRSQLSKHHSAITICKRCLAYFHMPDAQEKLTLHQQYCNENTIKTPAKYTFTEAGECLTFTKTYMSQPVDFIAFADFEVMLIPTGENESNTDKNTVKTFKHVPIAFCYYIIGPDNQPFNIDSTTMPVSYVGLDAAEVFMTSITKQATAIAGIYKKFRNLPILTATEQEQFHSATSCCICFDNFVEGDVKVRHHSHTTNKFLYDAHLIALVCYNTKKDITTIPLTSETYISFSKKVTGNFFLPFVDSYCFLPSALRTLVKTILESELIHTRLHFPDPLQFSYVRRKNFFPYEFLDSEDILQLSNLPPREAFYSSLDDTNISKDDYTFAHNA